MRHKRGVYLIVAGLAAGLITLTGSLGDGTPRRSGWLPVPGVRPAAAEEKLKAGMIDPKTGKKIKYWAAPMDPTYIRKEPGKSPMGMDLVPVYEDDSQTPESPSTIRIDPATIQNMGVRTAVVERKPAKKTIRTFGNITYDETLIYAVNTKFDGWIERLFVDFEGEQVKRGQPLFPSIARPWSRPRRNTCWPWSSTASWGKAISPRSGSRPGGCGKPPVRACAIGM